MNCTINRITYRKTMQPYIAGVVMLACIEHHLFVSAGYKYMY